MTQAGGTVRLRETGSRMIVAVPYMPSRKQPLGIGEVDLDAHRSGGGIFGFRHPRNGPRERLASEGVDAKLGRVTHAGDDDVAVGNLDDDAHQVGPLDRQERRLSALGRRANESARVKGPVGDDAVERGDDPGVVEVDRGLSPGAPRPH